MKNRVVILIITHKAKLNLFERISLLQCYKILGHYPITLICPLGLDVSDYNNYLNKPHIDFIAPEWQSTYANFNRLKIEPFLYERYKDYDHILFYEPDAFVFKDELEYWCNQPYSFIGAPWVTIDKNGRLEFLAGGNGGFSLRNVKDHLRALHSFSFIENPVSIIESCINGFQSRKSFYLLKKHLKKLVLGNNTHHFLNDFPFNEDRFWSCNVAKNFDWFTTPGYSEGIKFSIEKHPERLFSLNNRNLPFGCHAWFRYNLDFWVPHIEKFGYNLS